MIEYIYIPIILLLYIRQYKFCQAIDDPVPREGYLVEFPRKVDPSYYDKRKPLLWTITNITVFIFTCIAIHLLFDWRVALLYAVHPCNTQSVVWGRTGNYYMSTCLLTLMALLSHGEWWGMPFYLASLHSTLNGLPLPFLAILNPMYLWYFPILALFLFDPRGKFRTHFKERVKGHEGVGIKAGVFRLRHLFIIPKVLAYYLRLQIYPSRLGFFHEFGEREAQEKSLAVPNIHFIDSTLFIIIWVYVGYLTNPLACLGWFLFTGLWSGYIQLGQFVSERYLPLPNVFYCVIVAGVIQNPVIFTILCTLYFARSWEYTPAYRHNLNLFTYSIKSFPHASGNHTNLYSYYLHKDEPLKAINPLYHAILNTYGNKSYLWMELASTYGKLQRPREALKCTENALGECFPKDKDTLIKQRDEIKEKVRKINVLQTRMEKELTR